MELHCVSQARPGGVNEDFLLASSSFVTLLDGAGVPPGVDTGCVHSVRWYVERLARQLLFGVADGAAPLADALAQAITATTDSHRETCEVAHPRSPSATVVAVRILGTNLDWLVLGDSTLILVDADGPQVISDRRFADVARRGRASQAGRAAHPGEDERWLAVVDQERAARNRPGGYWIAAEDPTAAAQALTGSCRLEDLRAILLASDGATRPVDRFGVYDWPDLVRSVEGGGPTRWLATVRDVELGDPRGERWPRAKTHDDATVALLRPSIVTLRADGGR